MAAITVEYSSNNSGGSWWLSDEDWYALERAGWSVGWYANQEPDRLGYRLADDDGRFLGALASEATRTGLSMREAIAEWERVTGEQSNALGCECCGTPHSFTAKNEDGSLIDIYSPEFPAFGERY